MKEQREISEREMPFEYQGFRKFVERILDRELTAPELAIARNAFFAKDCPTYTAHVIHYGRKQG